MVQYTGTDQSINNTDKRIKGKGTQSFQLMKKKFLTQPNTRLPGGSEVKASACNARDLGSIPGLGRSPGKGNGNPLQYSCLENPMDRGAWWAAVHGVAKSQTRLSDFTFSLVYFISANSKCNATQGDKPVISCKKRYNYKVQFECSPSLLSSQRCRHTLRSYHL